MTTIGILGAGTWGVTLGKLLAEKGNAVTVWSALPEETAYLRAHRAHPKLPGVFLPADVHFTDALSEAVLPAEAVVFAVPSVYIRMTARSAAQYINEEKKIISVAKGLEPQTLLTMSEVIREELSMDGIVALSGPTHAEEVAVSLPTMIVAACEDTGRAKWVQELFSTEWFRVYTNSDRMGVELCGALKNIMALAAGISEGLGYGDNAKAALITRGITEITRLGRAMGCDARTFGGLAGIGDLVVTATSRHSRNNRAGYLIGSGMSAGAAVKEIGMVVEGLNALEGAVMLAGKYRVEMPIVEAVNEIVHHGADPRQMVNRLMGRRRKPEFEEDSCLSFSAGM